MQTMEAKKCVCVSERERKERERQLKAKVQCRLRQSVNITEKVKDWLKYTRRTKQSPAEKILYPFWGVLVRVQMVLVWLFAAAANLHVGWCCHRWTALSTTVITWRSGVSTCTHGHSRGRTVHHCPTVRPVAPVSRCLYCICLLALFPSDLSCTKALTDSFTHGGAGFV